MNITDVGHLVSDQDEGEDKLEKAARREGKTVWDIAEFYIKKIFGNLSLPYYDPKGEMGKMNFERPEVIARATEHIPEMIEMIRKLEKKGFTYKTNLGVYFDVTKFKDYGKLSGQKISDKIVKSRSELVSDPGKRHPFDFALWLFTKGIHEKHQMRWNSPWGVGFPGWHIECSAISTKYLGNPFDIHTGGVDHIPVHHENEIAQTEAATGKKMANFWMHNEFNLVDGEKMSKSKGNFYTLSDVEKRGFDLLALKYLYLTSHYKTPLNFTWECLRAAQKSLFCLKGYLKTFVWREIAQAKFKDATSFLKRVENIDLSKNNNYRDLFMLAISDDLNTPRSLGILWKMIKDEEFSNILKIANILDFDKIFGLRLKETILNFDFSEGIKIEKLVSRRDRLRKEGKWDDADLLRRKILALGVDVRDNPKGSSWLWVR